MSNHTSNQNDNGLPPSEPYYDEEGNLHVTVITGGTNPKSSVRILLKSDDAPRPSGLGKGEAKIKDSFFDPLPEPVLDYFDPHPAESSSPSD